MNHRLQSINIIKLNFFGIRSILLGIFKVQFVNFLKTYFCVKLSQKNILHQLPQSMKTGRSELKLLKH